MVSRNYVSEWTSSSEDSIWNVTRVSPMVPYKEMWFAQYLKYIYISQGLGSFE